MKNINNQIETFLQENSINGMLNADKEAEIRLLDIAYARELRDAGGNPEMQQQAKNNLNNKLLKIEAKYAGREKKVELQETKRIDAEKAHSEWELSCRVEFEAQMETAIECSRTEAVNLYKPILKIDDSKIMGVLQQCSRDFHFRKSISYVNSSAVVDFSKSKYKYPSYTKYVCLDDCAVLGKLMSSGFPKDYLNASWDWQFPADADNLKSDILSVKKYIYDSFFQNKIAATGLYLQGKLGVGKSSLFGCIAKTLTKYLDVSPMYTTMQRLLTAYSCNDAKYQEQSRTAKILFIDCFGQENYNENRTAAVFDFFHERYGCRKTHKTFIASNLDTKTDFKTPLYKQIADYCADSTFMKIINLKGNSKRG